MDQTVDISRELSRISGDVNAFIASQKGRTQEIGDKQGELQARLLEVEQKAARSGGGGDFVVGGSMQSGVFSAAADELLAGVRGTNSARVELPISIKAALSDVNHTMPAENLGLVSTYTPVIARLIDLLPSRPVTGNTVTFLRVGYGLTTDSPPAPGNRAARVNELADKPESVVQAVPVTLDVETWAHWVETSKQILDDVSELKSFLDVILRGGVLDKVDAGIFAELTTGGNFTSFSPVSGETVADAVARIAAQIATAGGTGIVVALNPTDYLTMQLTKASTSGNYLGVPPNLAQRVVSVPAVTTGKILAFTGSGAQWGDRQGVSLTMGLTGTQFTRNAVTLLAEARGVTLIRNQALIAYGDVTAA